MTRKSFSPENLVKELKHDSKSLGLPENSTNLIVARVLESVLTWLENRDIITTSDLERVVGCELEKYSSDLAFVYQNRNKII